jgi:hypothetical protein
MTRAREIFLKQRQGPGHGANLRGSLQAVPHPNLEPGVKKERHIGPRQVDNFRRARAQRVDSRISALIDRRKKRSCL